MDEKNETGPAVEPKQARPHDELICELLDSRRPKTEREHAAAREIERLRDLCDDLYSDLLAAGSLAPRGCGAYALIQEAIKLRRDRWARKQAPNKLVDICANLQAELADVYSLLPAAIYMDPPDGGDVTPLEQMRRMAEDAANYRNGL